MKSYFHVGVPISCSIYFVFAVFRRTLLKHRSSLSCVLPREISAADVLLKLTTTNKKQQRRLKWWVWGGGFAVVSQGGF